MSPESQPARSAELKRLRIRKSADELQAFVVVQPGEVGSRRDVERAIDEAGVTVGVDTRVLDEIVNVVAEPDGKLEETCLASGLPATRGQDASFTLNVETEIQAGKRRADGTLDFRERGLLASVQPGTLVGRVKHETSGHGGYKVTGEVVPAVDGKALKMTFGPGVELEEKAGGRESDVRAVRAGVVSHLAGRLFDVVDHHLHQGDVDLRSGNLRSDASLSIKGNVQKGFEVSAGRDVEIVGSVIGGTVRAEGKIFVSGGLSGRALAEAGIEGSVLLGHAQECQVFGGSLIEVEKSVLNVDFLAVRIDVGGQARGGCLRAEKRIELGQAGAQRMGEIELAVAQPMQNIQTRAEIYRAEELERNRRQRNLSSRREGKRGRSGRALIDLEKQRRERLLSERRRQRELMNHADILIYGEAYAGTLFRIGTEKTVLEGTLRGIRVSFDPKKQTIRVDRLSANERKGRRT